MTKFFIQQSEAKSNYARTVYPFRFGYGSTRKWVPKSQFQLFIMMEKTTLLH
jgi:hypothetical protein